MLPAPVVLPTMNSPFDPGDEVLDEEPRWANPFWDSQQLEVSI